MDDVDADGYLLNPSSLHPVLHRPTRPPGGPGPADDDGGLTRGVDGRAVRLDGRHSYVDVDTSALKRECFGDLAKCHMGEYNTRRSSRLAQSINQSIRIPQVAELLQVNYKVNT